MNGRCTDCGDTFEFDAELNDHEKATGHGKVET